MMCSTCGNNKILLDYIQCLVSYWNKLIVHVSSEYSDVSNFGIFRDFMLLNALWIVYYNNI